MFKNLRRNWLFALFALASSGIIHQQALAQQPAAKLEGKVKTIAVIAAGNPSWYYIKNKNIAQPSAYPFDDGSAVDSRQASKEFTEKMKAANVTLGAELTKTVVDELNQRGFKAYVLQGLQRNEDDYENIKYKNVKSDADVVLHVYFYEVGAENRPGNGKYLPKVNVTGYVFNPRNGEYIHEETVWYGVGSREGESWGVMGDPDFAYGSFEELMKNTPQVIKGLDSGAQAAGKRLAKNIAYALD